MSVVCFLGFILTMCLFLAKNAISSPAVVLSLSVFVPLGTTG